MTEQQYRVVADRDKGDDPVMGDIRNGDRYTCVNTPGLVEVVRIERPVPTTDRPDLTRDQFSNDESYYLATGQRPTPHPPTREQIAEVVSTHRVAGVSGFGIESIACACNRTWITASEYREHLADALLALIQNGADR